MSAVSKERKTKRSPVRPSMRKMYSSKGRGGALDDVIKKWKKRRESSEGRNIIGNKYRALHGHSARDIS